MTVKLTQVVLKDPAPSILRRGSGVRVLRPEDFGGHLQIDEAARVVRALVLETMGAQPKARRVSIPLEAVDCWEEAITVDGRKRRGELSDKTSENPDDEGAAAE